MVVAAAVVAVVAAVVVAAVWGWSGGPPGVVWESSGESFGGP